ncbi:6894_t:CDS:2 [Entrophospora sp. SA101]|nr:13763_t:CDS:2 [Entrophospora candida]CAJ0632125.1 13411_t:CDS:2 [Entrophospora sp. SA101]CAJ0632133.1 13415_t:CDS:2 [Entrophospora sp. SA101]CAJ0752085.1 6894_t:CDS:2 [Entrophospora sp. SA101]CAJ0832048.1 16704_t:CDS:2 [Entrophospora sp. SA101]
MDLAKNLIQLSSNSSNTKEEDYLINQINEYIKLYERIEERGIELNNQINSYHEKIQQTKQPVTKSAEQNWILATVVGYKPEVEDADQFEASNRLFTVPNKHVLPIANRGEIKINEFPKDHPVLALYTETTCFYKAVVVLPPSKITPSKKDCYLLEFEDDGHAHRYVESQYVLDIPKEVMDLKSNNTT